MLFSCENSKPCTHLHSTGSREHHFIVSEACVVYLAVNSGC